MDLLWQRSFITEVKTQNGNGVKKKGLLIYLKLAMIDQLPTDVISYKGEHPSFPHQSTADQFFDERQFEAYRELGYHVAWQAMKSKPVSKMDWTKPYNEDMFKEEKDL